MCYARTETVGRKKLDDRSRVLVHLGTEPGSKAYRLLDPLSLRIVISRDVVFEEAMRWRWSDKSVTTRLDNEGFELTVKGSGQDDHELEASSDTDDDNHDNNDYHEALDNHDDENQVGGGDENDFQPRRSTRVSNKPTYLDDYVLLAELEGEQLLMIINEEPWSFSDAKELKVWVDACKDEIVSI